MAETTVAYWVRRAALASRENLAFSRASERMEMRVSRLGSWAVAGGGGGG
jgi:hypothetical protein